jgi:hypothetical protein
MAEPRKRQSPGASASGSAPSKKPTTRKPRTRAREISADGIAERAYAISLSDACGSPEENWLRAEKELRRASG